MKKIISLALSAVLLGGVVYTLTGGAVQTAVANSQSANVRTVNGVQTITITAKGGYSPETTLAKAGVPTQIIMKTNGTFDCSRGLFIEALNFRNILPETGEKVLTAGTSKAGEVIQGVCGMGMYRFKVEFSNIG